MNRRWWSQHPVITGTISGVLATLIVTFIFTFAPIVFQSLLSINVVRILGGVTQEDLSNKLDEVVGFSQVYIPSHVSPVDYNNPSSYDPKYDFTRMNALFETGFLTDGITSNYYSSSSVKEYIERLQIQLSQAKSDIYHLEECFQQMKFRQTSNQSKSKRGIAGVRCDFLPDKD